MKVLGRCRSEQHQREEVAPDDVPPLWLWLHLDHAAVEERPQGFRSREGLTMPRPRQILANQFYLLSRRCTQRLFLLRPDDATTNAFLYCLAVAAQRYGIEIFWTGVDEMHRPVRT